MRTLLIAAVLVAGCAVRHDMSDVTRLSDGFQVRIKPAHKDETPEQLTWVSEHNAENGFCPNGYSITDRDVVQNGTAFGLATHAVTYTATCN